MAVLRAAAEGFDVLAVAYDAMLVSVPEAGAEALIAELQGIVEEAAELTVGIRIRVGCQTYQAGRTVFNRGNQAGVGEGHAGMAMQDPLSLVVAMLQTRQGKRCRIVLRVMA